MLEALGQKLQLLRPQSAFVRNLLKLVGGTAGSQVITVVSAPILTRLYGPESFGVLATFTSILALLNVVSSLRYELAIAIPEDDEEALTLLWLCFLLVSISTLLTVLGVALMGNQLIAWLHKPALKPMLWMLPVGVFLAGLYQPLSYWMIRRKQFSLLGQMKLRQGLFGLATNFASASLGTLGLLLGQIVSQSVAVVAILRKTTPILTLGPKDAMEKFGNLLCRYSHFGLYSSPAGVINTIGGQLPILIFASAFGMSKLGQLTLAMRLLLLPASLIGGSIGQMFLSEAAVIFRAGKMQATLRKSFKVLFIFGAILCASMIFIATPLVTTIFGREWSQMSWIMPLLLPLFFGQLVVSPLSMALIVSQQNRVEMLAQVVLALAKILPVTAALVYQLSFSGAVTIYSFGCLVGYVFYGICLWLAFARKLPDNITCPSN